MKNLLIPLAVTVALASFVIAFSYLYVIDKYFHGVKTYLVLWLGCFASGAVAAVLIYRAADTWKIMTAMGGGIACAFLTLLISVGFIVSIGGS